MDEKLRRAVRADVKRQIERSKRIQNEFLAEIYNKPKEYHFPPKDKIHMDRHFYFPKIFPGLSIPKSAMAVYPVMCSRANFEHNDWFQISQESIGKMAGVSINTVQKGIIYLTERESRFMLCDPDDLDYRELDRVELLEKKMTSAGKRHFYLYRAGFIRKDMLDSWRGAYFIFYTCIIDSGIWAVLKPRAKALYLSMRCAAKQDFDIYCIVEGEVPFCDQTGYDDYYRLRKWDVVDIPLAELGRWVNINVSDAPRRILDQLIYHRLVERVGRWFKVYLKPKIR